MTPTPTDECREAFEKEFSASINLQRDIEGEYLTVQAVWAWAGYETAWNRRAPAPAQAEGEDDPNRGLTCLRVDEEQLVRLRWRDSQGRRCTSWKTANEIGQLIERATPEPQGKGEQGEAVVSDAKIETALNAYFGDASEYVAPRQRMRKALLAVMLPAPAAPQPTAEGAGLRRAIELLTSSRSYVEEKTGYGLDDFAYKLVAEIDEFVAAQGGKL